jgi:RNA polymerase sigma factor (sigma-70 family)
MPRIQPPHRLLSDERLATLARAGDADAFTVLYARHEAALLGYCRSITRDPEDARDALQTALAHAYAGFDAKPPGAPVRAWLFRIAHNESVNVLRRRRSDVPLDDGDLSAASAADETVKRAAAHELLAEVARLPVRQRGALVLRELQGLAYGEIAVRSRSPRRMRANSSSPHAAASRNRTPAAACRASSCAM